MKKEAVVSTIFLLLLTILISFISADFVDDGTSVQNVTECGTLNTTNAVYTLNQSLTSSYDCLLINASNITLDCAGYNITFGNSSGGKGIRVGEEEEGYDNVTIQNCILVQNESGADHTAIFFGGNSENGVVYNNTITVFGYDTPGMLFESNSTNANMSFNNITTSGELGTGIVLGELGTGASITSNTITTSGIDATGIKISDESSNGLIYNNTIVTSGNWSTADNTSMGGILLDTLSTGINVSTNTITMSGYASAGVWTWSSYNHSIENNIITHTGLAGTGIFLSDIQGTNITSNTINITGNYGDAIYSYISETPILFHANTITTSSAYAYGFNLNQDSNSNFSSNNITTSGAYSYAIFSNQSHNNTIENNRIKTGQSTSYLVYLITSSNQSVYDNIFNTSTTGSGIFINDSDLNYFNTTNTTSTNIIGKTYIGGNFWTNVNESGYSDSCANLDADYFCDFAYIVITGESHTDYLPLTNYISTTSACGTLNTANRYYSLSANISSNGTCFNITANGITLDLAGFTITGNTTDYGINITGYNDTIILNGTISNFSNGIYISSSSGNSFTSININNSQQDAVLLIGATSDNNNFTNINTINTNSSYYDINFSTAGIDGTWIEGINFANYSFTGVGGKVNFKEPSFGEIVFLEAINGTGSHLSNDVDIENNSIFINSSINSGLNKSANISFYSVSFTEPRIQYSSDNVTWTNCATSTNPSCTNFSFTTGGTFTFNVSHFTYFKIIEGYSAPTTTTTTTTTASSGSTIPMHFPTEQKLKEGYTAILQNGSKIKFKFNNEYHILTTDSISNNAITITINSESQTKTINLNEETKFDLNDDKTYDISVELLSTTPLTAKIIMKSISEKIPEEEKQTASQSEEKSQQTSDETSEKNKSIFQKTILIILIIVIITAIIYGAYKIFINKNKF